MKKLLCMLIALGSSFSASAMYNSRRIPTSGAALGGHVPRNRGTQSMAQKLFERHRPQPHAQANTHFIRR